MHPIKELEINQQLTHPFWSQLTRTRSKGGLNPKTEIIKKKLILKRTKP
jgi:hypothetical protein